MPIPDFLVRLFTALALGAIVGRERRWRQRMAGTRTTAFVAAGACVFVMCAFLVRDTSRSETLIVSCVVSGVGFLGAGVIFKDGGTVRGLKTAATICCSAALGAICGLGQLLYGAFVGAAVLLANVVLRPLAHRLYPSRQAGPEREVTYVCDLVCRPEDEGHIRALLLQAIAQTPLMLTALKSEDTEGAAKTKVVAQIRGLGRQDQLLEQPIVRLSLEGGVTSIGWSVTMQVLE
jgi:putative Mg2+ transporter-C (MgtC) family protein